MTAGFFRHTMHHRANKIKQQLAMMKAAETQQTKGGFLMGGGGGGGGKDCPVCRASQMQPVQWLVKLAWSQVFCIAVKYSHPVPCQLLHGPAGVKSFFPAFGASSQQPAGAPNSGAAAVGVPPASGVTPNKPAAQPAAAGGQQGANINDAASDGGSGDDGPGTSPAKEAAASASHIGSIGVQANPFGNNVLMGTRYSQVAALSICSAAGSPPLCRAAPHSMSARLNNVCRCPSTEQRIQCRGHDRSQHIPCRQL
jgi:hypothetical protein